MLQDVGYAVLADLAVLGESIEVLEEDLGVQSRPKFDQDVGLFVVRFVPPVGGTRRDNGLLSLPQPSALFAQGHA